MRKAIHYFRKRCAGRGLVAGALILSLGWLPHDTILMEQARRVISVSQLHSYDMWLSDHELIQLVYHADDNRYDFVRLDTNTGAQTSLNALNRKYRTLLVANAFAPHASQLIFSVSCDGKWVMLSGIPTASSPIESGTYIATTLDGSSEVRWHSREIPSCFPLWLHDNRRWLEVVQQGNRRGDVFVVGAILHNIVGPGTSRRVRLTGARIREHNTPPTLKGITDQDHLLNVDREWHRSVTSVQIEDFDLLSSAGSIRRYRIPLPMSPCAVSDVALSPCGDRLAWLLVQGNQNQLAQGDLPKPLGLWVSHLDGADMTEIGHMVAPPHSLGDYEEEIKDLRWLPGGNRLSCTCYGEWYPVDVP